MRKTDVKLGSIYWVKVSGRLVRVRLEQVCQLRGWYGTNLTTGREVWIRTAGRLRSLAPLGGQP